MNVTKFKYYESLYREHGFFWNDQLAEFIRELGGKEFTYKHSISGSIKTARFCEPEWIRIGRELSRCQDVVDFYHQEAAPVGECHNKHVELFLCESGRFVGLTDYQFLEWGESDLGWRSSVRSLLNAEKAKIVGDIHGGK